MLKLYITKNKLPKFSTVEENDMLMEKRTAYYQIKMYLL